MNRERMMKERIGVLYGGLYGERDVSLETGRAVYDALLRKGYDCVLIDQGRDLPFRLREEKVTAAFIALHGKLGEDGSVQGLLEVMGIPYTGSKVLGSAVALDKHLTKLLLRDAGLSVAQSVLVSREKKDSIRLKDLPFEPPFVVKPNADGSSLGIGIVKTPEMFEPALTEAFRIDAHVLIEDFLEGKEIQVTVLDGKALGAIWVKPAREFYDYAAKYLTDDTEYIYPAPLPETAYRACLDAAETAFAALQAEGVVRIDFFVDDVGRPTVLEVNTMPGMTSHSLVPKTAAGEGIPFDELAERILLTARLGLDPIGDEK